MFRKATPGVAYSTILAPHVSVFNMEFVFLDWQLPTEHETMRPSTKTPKAYPCFVRGPTLLPTLPEIGPRALHKVPLPPLLIWDLTFIAHWPALMYASQGFPWSSNQCLKIARTQDDGGKLMVISCPYHAQRLSRCPSMKDRHGAGSPSGDPRLRRQYDVWPSACWEIKDVRIVVFFSLKDYKYGRRKYERDGAIRTVASNRNLIKLAY
jgi:hypothetical protein